MTRKNESIKMTYKEMKIYAAKINELKVKCKHCGHKEIFVNGVIKRICSYCGHYIFKDAKLEFKERIKGAIKHGKKRI